MRPVRTDNEGMFTGRLWARALRWLGVQHQRSAPGRPWRNGHIERLFGTVKPWLPQWLALDAGGIHTQPALDLVKLFYNEWRPRQALGGLSPMEVWHGITWADVARANEQQRTGDGRSESMRC
jgi:putative transposase